MKHASPKKLAFISAFTVGLTFMGTLLLAETLSLLTVMWYVYPAGGILIFVVAFLLFNYILIHFIYNKIRLVYKTIHDTHKKIMFNNDQHLMVTGVIEDVTHSHLRVTGIIPFHLLSRFYNHPGTDFHYQWAHGTMSLFFGSSQEPTLLNWKRR